MHEIRDYFLIGDLHTSALVSKYGSIETQIEKQEPFE